jgi:hypothetical protein
MSFHVFEYRASSTEIHSVDQLICDARALRDSLPIGLYGTGGRLWFRGHGDASKYRLIPAIGRQHSFGGNRKVFDKDDEEQLLHRFRRWSYGHERRVLDDWEAMLLARHHGLPTRILDWTESALVALFFACASHPDDDGEVCIIARRDIPESQIINVLDVKSHSSQGPLTIHNIFATIPGGAPSNITHDAIKIVYPFYNSPRIIAQSGMFTLHSNPWSEVEQYHNVPFVSERIDIAFVTKWRVPQDKKASIVKSLDFISINRRTLFPDLDGIAQTLWEREVLWRGTP